MSLTFTDVFCGAGGSSIGLAAAGFDLKLAANPWARAIETHSANFTEADHLCADVSNYDMRRLPKTDVLWASPECTWHSPAGGRRRARKQLDLFDEYVPDAAGERSRMTMVDVIRATEVHRYSVVIVENVVEVTGWELFDWWLAGMARLGYRHEIVCVSSAHVWGPDNVPAPQWRDRIYIVFTAEKVPAPDLALRPLAWCSTCDRDVEAMAVWKRTDRAPIGKYGAQYLYRCPRRSCRHQVVEPYVLPAAAAIDWSDLGQRIGDRSKPLAPATLRRIAAGLAMFSGPVLAANAGNTYEAGNYRRVWPALESPLNARQGTSVDGVATPPFQVHCYDYSGGDQRRVKPITDPLGSIVANGRHLAVALPQPFVTMLRRHGRATGTDEPLATLAADGRHHALTVPPGAFLSKHHGGLDYKPIEHMNKGVDEPMPGIVAAPNISLVIPYRRGHAKPTTDPLLTLGTRDSAGLCSIEVDVDDCHFRMLKPREHLRGQRFPDSYVVKGNQGEQTMQAGNAVSSNVAQWLGERIREVLA
jgi:DNA (cytosine-5)-methyltransferase 1